MQSLALQSIQLGYPTLPEAGSRSHFNIVAKWIKFCDEKHRCYSERADFFPTRVLDVQDSCSDTIRLLTDTKHLAKSAKYLALSHRWNEVKKGQIFCTFKADIEGRKERLIEVRLLPKTLRDAVHVTRSLHLQYLWIDSLCIIQKDVNDWLRESSRMEQVYSSAYCTIAATCGAGPDDGFLKDRPPRPFVPMKVQQSDSTYYVCKAIDDFDKHVDKRELNTRAWVLQERALSRRTIHFAEEQTYWECGMGVRCETLTKGKK